MPYSLKIEITEKPKSLNKKINQHYFARHSENRKWDIVVKSLCFKELPKEPLSKAHLTVVRHYYRMLDFDGLVGSMKPIVDALINCGVLEDDSWGVLGAWTVDQVFRPKKDGFLLTVQIDSID